MKACRFAMSALAALVLSGTCGAAADVPGHELDDVFACVAQRLADLVEYLAALGSACTGVGAALFAYVFGFRLP